MACRGPLSRSLPTAARNVHLSKARWCCFALARRSRFAGSLSLRPGGGQEGKKPGNGGLSSEECPAYNRSVRWRAGGDSPKPEPEPNQTGCNFFGGRLWRKPLCKDGNHEKSRAKVRRAKEVSSTTWRLSFGGGGGGGRPLLGLQAPAGRALLPRRPWHSPASRPDALPLTPWPSPLQPAAGSRPGQRRGASALQAPRRQAQVKTSGPAAAHGHSAWPRGRVRCAPGRSSLLRLPAFRVEARPLQRSGSTESAPEHTQSAFPLTAPSTK